MSVKIEELENGLKITETIGSDVVVRYVSSYGFPFIRSTNEAGETYQVVDAVGEIYNLPAVPTDFLLININLQSYTPGTGDELIEDSYHLKPFRKDELIDKVLTIGDITVGSSIANVGLHSSGINSVFINGNLREKYIPDTFTFTPVTTGLKMLIIYAKDDSQIFYLAEGTEGVEAVEPPYTGLLVARLIASSAGTTITIPTEGFQLKANQSWVNLLLNDVGATVQTVSVHHAALRFNILSSAANIKIGGFRFYATQFLYDGIEITLRNETAGDLEITTIAGIGITSIDSDGLPISLKQFESIDLAYHLVDGVFYALKSGGGSDPLKLDKPLSPNNTSERLIEADGGTTAKGNYQRSKQFFVSLPATVSEDWKGCIVFFTSSGNLTVPIGLTADFTFNGVVDNGVTLTPAITSPMAWFGTAPTAFSGVAIFTMVRRDGTNNFQILGV